MAARVARWMRLAREEGAEWRAACRGLAAAQSRASAPIVAWRGGSGRSHAFAFIVPRRLAPGRSRRWPAWALSPAVAAYRMLGIPAYLEGAEIRLHGRRLAGGGAEPVGECALIAADFPCGGFAVLRLDAAAERLAVRHRVARRGGARRDVARLRGRRGLLIGAGRRADRDDP